MPGPINYDQPLDPHDQAISDELRELERNDSSDLAGAFDHALGRGATLDLLSRLAYVYVTRDSSGRKVTGLPYIDKLLDADFDKAVVRDLFVRFCLIEGWQCEESLHQEGFWNDHSAWRLFESSGDLLAFLCSLAEFQPHEMLASHDRLATQLGLRRLPDDIYSREARTKAGLPDARIVMMHAVRSWKLGAIMTDRELEVILELPTASVAMAACRVGGAWIRDLILKGYALADHLTPQREADVILNTISQEIDRRPHRAPEIHRWVLEGIRRAGGEQYWQFSRHYEYLRYMLESSGWKFMRLTARDNPRRPGQPDLQVELKGRGSRIVLKYLKGDLGDHLKEGDEVIVSERLFKEAAPVFTGPNLKIYVIEIPAAAPPNMAMAEEHRKYNRFYPNRKEG